MKMTIKELYQLAMKKHCEDKELIVDIEDLDTEFVSLEEADFNFKDDNVSLVLKALDDEI
jgi:hypothetical protein